MSEERKSNIFRVRSNSPSGIIISNDMVRIIGDKNTFLTLTPDHIGVNSSKLVIKAEPHNIIKGILFKENLGFAQTIPSSSVTPISNLVFNVPGAGLIKELSQGTPGLAMLNFIA